MGICDSTPKKPVNQQMNNNQAGLSGMKAQQVKGFNQSPSMGNPNEELYYQEIALCNNFGNDFGPKQKIQLNVGIRSGDMGASYSVEMSMSYDKKGIDKILIGRTKDEQLVNTDGTLNFGISLITDYFFEKQQYLWITVRKMGQAYNLESTLGRIMGSIGNTLALNFAQGIKDQVLFSVSTLKNSNMTVCLNFSASSMGSQPNVFFLIKKLKIDSSNSQKQDFWKIQKSEVRLLSNAPSAYNPIRIPAMFLCNGDFDHPLVIEFHSPVDRNILGVHNTTVNRLLSEKNFNVGNLQINCNGELKKEHTFIDYLRGGKQLSLTLAIDFTGSNGHPRDGDSLHSMNNNGSPNQYQLAVRSCGDILAYYDYDQSFPTYGYGAILPGRSDVSPCFPLNLTENPNINTIDGVLEVYRNIMPTLSFSGPTYFAPILNQAIHNIRNSSNPSVYHILLILTDGVINDMNDTIAALVEGSSLPLSVIIVGVGNGDFGNMDLLDADGKGLVDFRGRRASRDLVQFVPFYKFANNAAKLAEQVLGEVPRQLVDFYKTLNEPPGDPIVKI